jgi:hypothetical protein
MGKKEAKGAQSGILDAVLGVWSCFAMGGQLLSPPV